MPPPDSIPSEQELVAVIRGLVSELQPERAKAVDISLSSRLERDLGIDSLARTELILRIERTFRVRLPSARPRRSVIFFVRWSRLIPVAASAPKWRHYQIFLPCRLPRKGGHWSKRSSGT